MKKVLLPLISLLLTFGASAATLKKARAVNQQMKPMAIESSYEEFPFTYPIVALYDDANYKVPNFYVILSTSADTKYDGKTGTINAAPGSYTLILDLYNNVPEQVYLPSGTYKNLDDPDTPTPFGYASDYSMFNLYDPESGQISLLLDQGQDVVIERNEETGYYSISTLLEIEGDTYNLTYNGPLAFSSATERGTVYPQINHDVTADLNMGGIAFYQGVTEISSNGVSYYNLFDVSFDRTNGRMDSEGYNLVMMVAHKRVVKKADYQVMPGTYTKATNLDRDTWYPAREIDYLGYVVPFGSYIREMKIVGGERTYSYAYLKEGTFTVEDNGDGTYKGTLDAVSTLGYSVKCTWSGEITLNTDNATFPTTVSDLIDDVELDFSKLDFGRIYHNGISGGCRTLVVDLGSPTGQDEGIQYGGDLLRMEFLVDPKDHLLYPGLYTVVPIRWNSNELAAGGTYEPMSLNKGYFNGNGAQIGTRYAHFENDRYCVYDMVGPAEAGSVFVETDDFENYKFTIDLEDDAGFKITGVWDKPIVYCYNPESINDDDIMGVEEIGSDSNGINVVVEGDNLFILNAGNEAVALYDVYGRLVLTTTADKMISTAELAKGIYVVKVKNTSVKVAL